MEEGLNAIKRKYVKWILGLDWRTPNYILVEETNIRELGQAAKERAIGYEEVAKKKSKKLILEWLKEMDGDKRFRKTSTWEEKRRIGNLKTGMGEEEARRWWEDGRGGARKATREMIEREERREREQRIERIERSNYNAEYKKIRTEEIPAYLKG